MRHKKIGVLCGGLSAERDISLRTGEAICSALVERGFDATRIYVDRDLDLILRQTPIDVAFLALHGRYGEDGCVQGLLELFGIPYTGSSVLASALAMDKVKAKQIFRLHNLPTPPYYVVRQGEPAIEAHGSFGYPVVVKPCHEGSSVGVTVVRDADDLEAACEAAFAFDDEILVERLAEGREISVAVLNDRALGAIEIASPAGFYDFGSKLAPGKTELVMPARLSPERYRGVLTQALAAHRAVGATGVSRVDMIVSDRGNEVLLEVNTIPAMSQTSLLPIIAAHAGLDFGTLVEEILGAAALHTPGRTSRERRFTELPYEGPERRTAARVVEPH